MGIATFDIARYGRTRGGGAASVIGELVTSGAYTTSTTASALEDGAGGITARAGDVLHIVPDEAMRVAFGGTTATATVGHYLQANVARDIEIPVSGAISIIDVA